MKPMTNATEMILILLLTTPVVLLTKNLKKRARIPNANTQAANARGVINSLGANAEATARRAPVTEKAWRV
jgi:hypothetical protein